MTDVHTITDYIRNKALEVGFDACGFAPAGRLDEAKVYLENWLARGFNGHMHYMANHFEKRLDPQQLMPGTKSVIVVMLNYFPIEELPDTGVKISKYAYGRDYHKVIKAKLKTVVNAIEVKHPDSHHRIFVDSAPVMEKAWAQLAGLGWIGKNTLLIHKERGSFSFIGIILSSLKLDYDAPVTTDYCGSCTRCLQACPTNALIAPRMLDSRRCISYLTIELKDSISETVVQKLNKWVFGCDICQDVCPWNRKVPSHNEQDFHPRFSLTKMVKDDWLTLTRDKYEELFNGTPVRRASFEKLCENIRQAMAGNL